MNGLISLHVMLNVTKLDKCSETGSCFEKQWSTWKHNLETKFTFIDLEKETILKTLILSLKLNSELDTLVFIWKHGFSLGNITFNLET